MRRTARHRTKIGRPPAGIRDGECVKDYPQLSIRVPPETRTKLNAISAVTSKPQWRIVRDGIDCYFDSQPESERQRILDEWERELP